MCRESLFTSYAAMRKSVLPDITVLIGDINALEKFRCLHFYDNSLRGRFYCFPDPLCPVALPFIAMGTEFLPANEVDGAFISYDPTFEFRLID